MLWLSMAAATKRCVRAERELHRMESEAETMRRDEEWLRFQVEEFEAAQLREGELAEAEAELSVLENADHIIEALTSLRNTLDADQIGVLEQLSVAETALTHLGEGYPQGAELASRLHSVVSELKDVGAVAADESDRIEADPERLQRSDGSRQHDIFDVSEAPCLDA